MPSISGGVPRKEKGVLLEIEGGCELLEEPNS